MKKLFVISETSKTLDQVKESLDFTGGIFAMDVPCTKEGFKIQENGHYYKLLTEKGEHAYDFDYNVTLLKDRENYEEFSEELNDWDENIEEKIKAKFPKAKYIDIYHNEIHTYDYHPFFIHVEFEMHDEKYEPMGEEILNFEVFPNDLEYETI